MLDDLLTRAVEDFPTGANSSDTIFGGVHFNLTTLHHFNYTYYSNRTVSNNSKCYLTFEPYQPALLFTNGTFVNATKCYTAIKPIAARGFAGIGLAVAFGVALVLVLTALAKHGPLYLPKERRFTPIGRRWQWYWACFTCAAALISLFTNVDVDRYYVQELPIIVTVFFYYLMCIGTMAMTWEAVRHWGSWMERQFVDPNPFIYSLDDRRAKVEFYLPLWVYFWMWMNFFLVVPRSWKFVEMQRSPEQTLAIFVPAATGIRWKIAGFFLFIAWLSTAFSMIHSISHYKDKHRGIFNMIRDAVGSVPFRFVLILPLCLATIAYQLFISWKWEYSVLLAKTNVPVAYGWGYGPSLVILYIQIMYGYFSPNEDKELIRQRHVRGDQLNRELGLVNKPAWWKRVRGDHLMSMRDKILNNVNEVGRTEGVGRRDETDFERQLRLEARGLALDDDIELNSLLRKEDPHNPRMDRAGAKNMDVTLADPSGPVGQTKVGFFMEGERPRLAGLQRSLNNQPPPPYTDISRVSGPSRPPVRSNSTSTTGSMTSPPQQIKSMLDI